MFSLFSGLRKEQRTSLILIAILTLLILPVSVWSVKNEQLTHSKAQQIPVSVPISTNPYCYPDQYHTIEVVAEGTCHNLQTAINAIPDNASDYYTIILKSPYYSYPRNLPESVFINNKRNITIQTSYGTNPAVLDFTGVGYGFYISNSTGSLDNISITNVSAGQSIYVNDTTHFHFWYLNLNLNPETTGIYVNRTYDTYIYGTYIRGGKYGIQAYQAQNLTLATSDIATNHTAVYVTDSVVDIVYNKLHHQPQRAIDISSPRATNIEHNTIVNNGNSNHPGVVYIDTYTTSPRLTFSRNILAFNFGGLIFNQGWNSSPNPSVINIAANNTYASSKEYINIPAQIGNNGNISADPLFGWDYCLKTGSPSIALNGYYMGHWGPCTDNPKVTDLDNDSDTDVQDINLFKTVYFLENCASPADLNRDCKNNLYDFNRFFSFFTFP